MPDRPLDVAAIQRRTVRLLFLTQVIGGVGLAVGGSVGALLAADLAGVGLSGVAQSASVVGAALFAVPAAAIVERQGRRPSLAAGYALAAAGALLVVAAAMRHSVAAAVRRPVPLRLWLGGGIPGALRGGGPGDRCAPGAAPLARRVGDHARRRRRTGPRRTRRRGAGRYGVPTLAGPFVFSALLFVLAALVLLALLRPDPAVVARDLAERRPRPGGARRSGVRAALPVVLSRPAARLGVSAMAIGHVVMVGVMTMTPVHIRGAGHDAARTLDSSDWC